MTITAELEYSLETRGAAVGLVPASLGTEDRALVTADLVRAADLVMFGRDDLKMKLITGEEFGTPLVAMIVVVAAADALERLP
jgi:hypothetical protein